MKKTVVLNVVGLTSKILGEHTPFLAEWTARRKKKPIEPVLPAVTCSAQSTYLTGKLPAEHGIVANGWYFAEDAEVKFWRQPNQLVQARKVWDVLKKADENFTCANLFWWYNMYSSVDYSVTPRPMYPADGLKIPDIYTHPSTLRKELQEELGQFPLFKFWGPATSIEVSRWIAAAAKMVDKKHDPTLTLIYIPHLDYNFQRLGPDSPAIAKDLREVDGVCRDLITYYERKGAEVMVLSEYGITAVNRPVFVNRLFRERGFIEVREELGLEVFDPGASSVFAVCDHQIAHIYLRNKEKAAEIKLLLEQIEGIEQVLSEREKKDHGLAHSRAGDLIAIADAQSWFCYYYWLDDARAPDFARTVDIHRKPGYDPVELFLDPEIRFPKGKIALKLLKKKLGFRNLMNVIPLKPELVKGSHGRRPESEENWPVIISTSFKSSERRLRGTDVFQEIIAKVSRAT